MDDTFLTLKEPAEGLYKDKGSRFIAITFPVENEDEIKEKLISIKKQYHDARHHCYAWILGFDGDLFRMNDDGEPSGTAGRPIYGQLVLSQLTNVLMVVIRYFGGTKLGVRGLINAYKGAAEDALKKAEIIERIRENNYRLVFDYPAMNAVMKVVKAYDLNIHRYIYEESCILEYAVRLKLEHAVLDDLLVINNISISKL